MNQSLWFRVLQVAVAAPYIYSISEQQKNPYFRLGLKLVAGSILVMNLEPLWREAQPMIQAAIKMKAEADRISAAETANAIEGEFTTVEK
jgi:hypothetical protein